jgi:YidC/Oxa1 family membrane protein insertase
VPVLLQLPVFFALYKVLFITIDMRHAPFFGWIKDLSAPDPTSLFNLFGLLPYDVPAFLHIGVWPLVMGVTMWLQMQLNPKQPDPVQQQIFSWMPVMFTFLLASFPAGLVIYWAWSNTLSLAQQYAIMKRQGAEIHLIGNISNTFKPLQRFTERALEAVKQRTSGKATDANPSGKRPRNGVDGKDA